MRTNAEFLYADYLAGELKELKQYDISAWT